MTPQRLLQRTGATRGKLALVAVLAAVLVAVIVFQSPGTPSETPQTVAENEISRPNAAQHVDATPTTPASNTEPPRERAVKQWPTMALETIVQHDPFARPEWARATDKAAVQVTSNFEQIATRQRERLAALESLKRQGVSMVMLVEGENVARLGPHELRVGDEISGFRVAEINPDGIVLEPSSAE